MTMNQSANPYHNWHDLLTDPRFAASGETLRQYLTLCEGLESPTPYHVWSFVSLIAALAGDKIGVSNGPLGRTRLNLGIVLSGVPAIRKSTAMSLMQKFANGLPVSYGPTDTAGQRQGIMSAMLPRWQREFDDVNPMQISPETLEELALLDTDSIEAKLPDPLARRSSEIYFVAKELGRLIASNTRELFDFFMDGMDGETFHYQLKNQVIRIEKPLINLLGATTPSSLGTMLPKGGESHGFLSRLIFVHAPVVERVAPNPQAWDDRQERMKVILHDRIMAFVNNDGFDLKLSDAARATYDDLYTYHVRVVDVRLNPYSALRAGHLMKVAAILALLRDASSRTIIAADIRLAHGLLVLTESTMDRAYANLEGSMYSRIFCTVGDMIESSEEGAITVDEIQTYAGHLGNRTQINEVLQSLVDQGRIADLSRLGKNNMWGFNTKLSELGIGGLRLAFLAGPAGASGPPGPDEFRTHRSGVKEVKEKQA